MLRNLLIIACLSGGVLLAAACSSTSVTSSWRDPDYSGLLRKIYVVGIAKQEVNRRIFEDEFSRQLQGYGVTGVSSYKDLADPQTADKDLINQRVIANRADSMLMTRMTAKRTEEVVTPGRISGYQSWPYDRYYHPYSPAPYYRNWGSYYDRRFEAIYEPATITRVEVATIEANLYDARSGALIWAAQVDVVIEANTQKLIADFVTAVVKDLRQQGLL